MKSIRQGRFPYIRLVQPIFCPLGAADDREFSTALAPMFQGTPQKNSLFTLEDVAELLFFS